MFHASCAKKIFPSGYENKNDLNLLNFEMNNMEMKTQPCVFNI